MEADYTNITEYYILLLNILLSLNSQSITINSIEENILGKKTELIRSMKIKEVNNECGSI